MKYQTLHDWNVTPTEAVAIQKQLRDKVRLEPLDVDTVELVAGADISYNKFSDTIYAGIVLIRLPEFSVVETSGVVSTMTFPYIPGLLSFREMPAVIQAWEKLTTRPDVFVLDGQGIAHPRRVGIACHAGLVFDVPTIGCAKTLFVGKYEEPDERAGSLSPLVDRGEQIGTVVRTKHKVNPVYVSPGHRADLSTSAALALRCAQGYDPNIGGTGSAKYRIPDPTRLAHLFVNAMRRGEPWPQPT